MIVDFPQGSREFVRYQHAIAASSRRYCKGLLSSRYVGNKSISATHIFISKTDRRLAGFAYVEIGTNKIILSTICTNVRGHGTLLMQAVIDYALKSGRSFLELHALSPVWSYYRQKFGFRHALDGNLEDVDIQIMANMFDKGQLCGDCFAAGLRDVGLATNDLDEGTIMSLRLQETVDVTRSETDQQDVWLSQHSYQNGYHFWKVSISQATRREYEQTRQPLEVTGYETGVILARTIMRDDVHNMLSPGLFVVVVRPWENKKDEHNRIRRELRRWTKLTIS